MSEYNLERGVTYSRSNAAKRLVIGLDAFLAEICEVIEKSSHNYKKRVRRDKVSRPFFPQRD